MDKFENVSVIKKANVYFDGGVTSRTVLFADGVKKTLGFINPGEYEFDTNLKEVMEILGGSLNVLLPGSDEWITVEAGESFEIPANSLFKVSTDTFADYCCSYIAE
ncbi:MAG: pyrimidine/purine nucleoside phosphorylase [Deferribacterales bacterium]